MASADRQPKFTRRQAIKHGLVGAAALAALGPRRVFATPASAASSAGAVAGLATAKAVIQVWLWGGPSHIDTFDPKPDAGEAYTGPLNQTVDTNVAGIRIGQLLPQLAKQADKYSLIRSMTHGVNAHETASYLMQTGYPQGRVVHPSLGAVVGKLKGYDAGYKGLVPPYVVLTRSQGRFSESGFLGQKYKPFCTGGDPNRTPFAVEGVVAQGVTDERQLARRELLHELDTFGKAMPSDAGLATFDETERHAYDVMFGDTRKLFDLSSESTELRDRYGRNTLGQSCLMARRLVEAGVPHVTINAAGWDTHKQHFPAMNRKLPELDAGLATLLADLSDHGLLGSTIVLCGGEFGRTPKVQWEAPWNGGRGHYGKCFSVLVAGGGFKGGRIVGESDATASEVTTRPVYPYDLMASVYQLLGIDPAAKLANPRNHDVTVLPTGDAIGQTGGILKEIMA